MSVTVKQTAVPLWHYVCPECGFGSAETGHHAPTHMIYCEICLEDDRQVKLRRWQAEQDASSGPLPGDHPAGR
jgi:hypothetical protein